MFHRDSPKNYKRTSRSEQLAVHSSSHFEVLLFLLCLRLKLVTGYSLFRNMNSHPFFQTESPISADNWNPATRPGIYTGNFYAPSRQRFVSQPSNAPLEMPATPSRVGPTQLTHTYGRKTLEFMELNLNLAINPCSATTRLTGIEYGQMLGQDDWIVSTLTYTFGSLLVSIVLSLTYSTFRHYNSLKRIAVDHMVPVGIERRVEVFWGTTGVGKSRRAWDEAGLDAYPKDPRSKFWDGYRGQEHVVIDEFRGGIDIAHMLRWLDRYPVIVEVKGSSVVLKATRIWITSNIPPEQWYPDLDEETKAALLRRLNVTHMLNNQLQ